MKTAVIYARYSSTNQTEQSIEGQVHVCEDFAKRKDIVIVDSYIDRAMSGTNDNRASFQKMLIDSNNKKWDYVLVYKLDRFARNKFESAIHRKHLKDNGVKLLSAMENIPETPEGILLESLLEGMNQYFSEELAQKLRRGFHESRMKGHCLGKVPYGYNKQNKLLSINQEESDVLKRIFEDYNAGKTVLQISSELENENITNRGRKFSLPVIRYILQNETYTGVIHANGYTYDKIYPPIISKNLFDSVNARLNKTRYGCRKDNHEVFRLKDKVFCGTCGKKMYPISAISSNGEHLRYYNCTTTKKDNCNTKLIYKDFLETCVDKVLISLFNNPQNLESISTKIYELYKKRSKSNTSLNSIKNELQKVNTAIKNIMDAIEQGVFTATTKQRLEELETKQIELREKVIIEESKERYELTKEGIQNYFKHTMKNCPDNTFETLVKTVKVYSDKIEIALNFMLDINQQESNKTLQKICTETFAKTRRVKGGKLKTKTKTYDIFIEI